MKTRTITSNECKGFISPQQKSANSITFCAELPEGAKVEHICIMGKVKANGGTLFDPILEDIDGVVVTYHTSSCHDGAIATAYFVDGIPEKLLADVQNYVIDSFVIDVIEVCPHCGG